MNKTNLMGGLGRHYKFAHKELYNEFLRKNQLHLQKSGKRVIKESLIQAPGDPMTPPRTANFIVSNNLSYRLVEDKSFRMVLSAFNPQRRPIGRHKLLTLLNHK